MPKYKYTCHGHTGAIVRHEDWECPLCKIMAKLQGVAGHEIGEECDLGIREAAAIHGDCCRCPHRGDCWDTD